MKYRFEIFSVLSIILIFTLIYILVPQADAVKTQKVIYTTEKASLIDTNKGHFTNSRFYGRPVLESYTSFQLSNADIAWHATQSYGWNCKNITGRMLPVADESFLVQCESSVRLRVYLRKNKHPKITNF